MKMAHGWLWKSMCKTTQNLNPLEASARSVPKRYLGVHRGHLTTSTLSPRLFSSLCPQLVRGKQSRFATDENGYLSHNVDELELTLESDFALDGQLYMPEKGRGPVILRSAGQASFLRL